MPHIPACFPAPLRGALMPSLEQVLSPPLRPPRGSLGSGDSVSTSTCQRFNSLKVSKGLSDKVP